MKKIEVIKDESRLEVYCYRTFLDFKNSEVFNFWKKIEKIQMLLDL